MTFKDVIALWPSRAELAADVGEKIDTVQKWVQRERIPATAWVRLVRAAEKRELPVTIESLSAISERAA